MLWFACNFPFVIFSLVLCLTLFTSSGVFVIFLFFPARSFQVFATSPAGGGTTVCFFYFLLFFTFVLFFRIIFFAFVFVFVFFFALLVSFRFSIS